MKIAGIPKNRFKSLRAPVFLRDPWCSDGIPQVNPPVGPLVAHSPKLGHFAYENGPGTKRAPKKGLSSEPIPIFRGFCCQFQGGSRYPVQTTRALDTSKYIQNVLVIAGFWSIKQCQQVDINPTTEWQYYGTNGTTVVKSKDIKQMSFLTGFFVAPWEWESCQILPKSEAYFRSRWLDSASSNSKILKA